MVRKGWLLASFGVSLFVLGCGGSSGGGGTGGSGGHAGSIGTGTGGHAGTVGTAGAGGGAAGAAGGTAGAAGGHAGSGGTAGAAGGHAGSAGGAAGGTAGAAGGTAGAAGGHAGSGGAAGAAGGHAGSAGGAAGGAAGSAGGAAGSSPDGGLVACGTSTMTSQISCTNNTLDATGPCVTVTTSTAAVPAATGGNIQPGTYDLVSAVAHLAADAALPTLLSPVRKTAVLSPGTAGAVNFQEADQSGNYLNRFDGTITTSASMLTFTQTCPQVDAGAGGNADYSFDSATAMLTVTSDRGNGTMLVETWQKR